MNYLWSAILIQFFSWIHNRFEDPWSIRLHSWSGGQSGDIQARGRPTVKLEDPLTTHTHCFPHRSIIAAMSLPSSSPEREGSCGALPQLECPSSPSGMDQDPLSTGSPVLSPDSSSHDAVLSAPAASPADSENLSPDELELLAKLEEQNRWELSSSCIGVKTNQLMQLYSRSVCGLQTSLHTQS